MSCSSSRELDKLQTLSSAEENTLGWEFEARQEMKETRRWYPSEAAAAAAAGWCWWAALPQRCASELLPSQPSPCWSCWSFPSAPPRSRREFRQAGTAQETEEEEVRMVETGSREEVPPLPLTWSCMERNCMNFVKTTRLNVSFGKSFCKSLLFLRFLKMFPLVWTFHCDRRLDKYLRRFSFWTQHTSDPVSGWMAAKKTAVWFQWCPLRRQMTGERNPS